MWLTRRSAIRLALGGAGAATLGLGAALVWDEAIEKHVVIVAPGRLLRGAWQRPWPLRRLIAREKIRTIVTLTAINRDDPKYVRQARWCAKRALPGSSCRCAGRGRRWSRWQWRPISWPTRIDSRSSFIASRAIIVRAWCTRLT